jgi:hypothetical protein
MVLARWQATIVDDAGNVQPAASVTVREETSGNPLANLFSDRAGVVSTGNPITADADGFAAFHVAGGAYQITATKGSFTRTWRYVGVGTMGEEDFDGFSVTATGTTASRPLVDHLADLFSIKDFGAIGNGTADDTGAVTTADALAPRKFVPSGIYDVTLTASDLDGPYWGSGQIRDSSNNLRGPWFSAIKAAPSSFGNHDAVTTAFNGDLSKVQIAMEHRITGSATLGTPATGYQADPETSPIYINVFNSSGHNEQLSGNDGRTACAPIRIQMANAGQGDMLGIYINGVVANTLPGATHVLASPALSMFAGALFAGANGVYLNPAETQMHDNGFDVAALGWNMVMNRTNITGAIKAWWGGFRVQSIGSQPANVAFQAVGPIQYGIDLVHGTYTNQAAIALKADNRIYGNALVDTDSVDRFPADTGNDYLTFSSSLNAWNLVVDAVAALQIYTDRITGQVPLVMNHTAAVALGPSLTPRVQVISGDAAGMGVGRFSNGATGPSIMLSKSRSATLGAHTIITASDTFGIIRFCGSDGTGFIDGVLIEGRSDGTPGTNDMPGALIISTTPDGAAAAVERLRVTQAGNVLINTAAIATNATDGFLYVPTCAGTPTGTPTAFTGRAPIVVNTTNNKLYFYSSGAWRDAGP